MDQQLTLGQVADRLKAQLHWVQACFEGKHALKERGRLQRVRYVFEQDIPAIKAELERKGYLLARGPVMGGDD